MAKATTAEEVQKNLDKLWDALDNKFARIRELDLKPIQQALRELENRVKALEMQK